jgi:hypothetical protein
MIKLVQAFDPKAIAELESDDTAAPDRRSSPATCCKRRRVVASSIPSGRMSCCTIGSANNWWSVGSPD